MKEQLKKNHKEQPKERGHHLRISDMAAQSKPREKAERYGIRVLTDAELLAMILRSGSQDENVIVLCERLLNLDPKHPGLSGLNYLSQRELTKLPGIGPVKALQLLAVAELSRRMIREETRDHIRMNRPETIAGFFREDMRYLQRERVTAVFFDSAGNLLKEALISEGTVNRSLLSPREVFVEALACGAVYFVVLHNHPSGDPEPSPDDLAITRDLYILGNMLGIPLMDHIIIGNKEYVSLAERGCLNEIQL